jgi:hypothetical protein
MAAAPSSGQAARLNCPWNEPIGVRLAAVMTMLVLLTVKSPEILNG